MDLKSMMDQLSLQTGLDYTDLLLMARAAQDMSFADSLALPAGGPPHLRLHDHS